MSFNYINGMRMSVDHKKRDQNIIEHNKYKTCKKHNKIYKLKKIIYK